MIHPISLLLRRNRSRLIQVGVVSSTLCLLPAVGFLVTELPPVFVLLALIAPLAILAVVRQIQLGLATMLLAGVFVGFRIPTGTASEIVISLVICVGCIALWIIDMLVVKKRLALGPAPTNVPLLAFIATVPVSWVWSRAFRDVLVHEAGHPLVSVVAGLVMMLLPGCFLLVANNIRSVGWLRVMVSILIAEGLVVLALDLGPAASLRQFFQTNGCPCC